MKNRDRQILSGLLCAGASAFALLGPGGAHPALAQSAAQLLSQANIMQAAGQHNSAASQAAAASALANPEVRAQIALSAANLAKAAAALKAQTAAQSAASASSQLTLNNAPLSGSAWNGTALSGLKPVDDTNPSLWVNADALQKNTATKTATVTQTSANAILTWQSFDLNKGETLVFDQQGNANWSVLNRIVAGPANADGSRFLASPSYILGSVQAAGTVYVINPNGVIFGPTAQINVHSLIASSLDVGNPTMTVAERNSFFLNQGITSSSLSGTTNDSFSYNQADTQLEGNVVVEAGATITANLAPRNISPDAGGFVYLIAPNVSNAGTIVTPAGETLMVAAQQVQLTPNIYSAAGQSGGTFRAVGVNFNLAGAGDEEAQLPWRTSGTDVITAPGLVTNTGLIDAERGVVILNGDEVTNGTGGVIQADTSITRNSEIFLDARLQLTIAGGSTVEILPDENGETIPLSAISSATAANPAFVPGSIEMQGNTVDIESGGLVLAPGGTVNITGVTSQTVGFVNYPEAAQTIVNQQLLNAALVYMAPDASVDVSGLDNVELPMSDDLVSFKPFGNEFADQPLQRNGALRGVELTVDIRETGTYDGVNWIGTPLADVNKTAGNVPESIDQLLTTGGQVTVNSQAADTVVLRQGSTINVGGGYVSYQGGMVATTNLLTSQGQVVNIANANPLVTYVGIAGVSTLTHPHWGASTTQYFVDPLLTSGQYEQTYIEGHDAGGVTFNSSNPSSDYALDGTFYAGAIIGQRQAALGVLASSAAAKNLASPDFAIPTSGSFTIYGGNDLVLENTVDPLPSDFTINSALPADHVASTLVSTSELSDAGFGQFTAKFAGSLDVAAGANLTMANGGAISITAGSADIEGDLTAHAGSISVQTDSTLPNGESITVTTPTPSDAFDLVVGPHAVLDVSGIWVNDAGANVQTLTGSAFVNGGSISLTTETVTAACSTAACLVGAAPGITPSVDVTGSIVLSAGSLLNVSSGGRIGTNGLFQADSAGRAVGAGGNVTLETYADGFSLAASGQAPTTTLPEATIIVSGSDGSPAGDAAALERIIHGYGFETGGTLTIQAPTIQIGGKGSTAPGVLNLAASFFDGNGFATYDLSSVTGGITVAANTTVVLRQRNLNPDTTLVGLPTGANVTAATGIAYLPSYIRDPVNLTLDAALPPLPVAPYDNPPATVGTLAPAVALLIGQGAVIDADPLARIDISVTGRTSEESAISVVGNVDSQLGVAEILGTIRAPGGSIVMSGPSQSEFWLGSKSRLDVAGVTLHDPYTQPYDTGTVLPGGTVSISTASDGALIALRGAVIDVSGTESVLDVPQASTLGPNGIQPLPTEVWSDAGSISLSAATLLFDGTFKAEPGAALANGGSLTISLPEDGGTISVARSGNTIPAGLTPTTDLTPYVGTAEFLANRLTGSGIADLTLSAGPTTGQIQDGTVHFGSGVDISGLNRLIIDAATIALSNPGQTVAAGACSVCLDANYFEWQGSGNADVRAGRGILTVTAGEIDLAGGGASGDVMSLAGVAQANFDSATDIRLLTPIANAPVSLAPDALLSGQLLTDGSLTLDAAQVYPATDVDFTLKSAAKDGTITIEGNGAAAVAPLSVGGQVTIDATFINQDGRLVAPLGVIRLGVVNQAGLSSNDETGIFVATREVTLGKGSVTSVSLAGSIVPYGETTDNQNWSYDSQSGLPLTAAPAKEITIGGSHVDLSSGATVDLSGGGDIQAMEFVNGTGGTRDVLAEPNVYAIIPGYNPAAAPVDYDFSKIQGDTEPPAGSSIYLTASSGLPAGYYTLLPAHYATLPGAYRVQVTSTQNAVASQNGALPDGTLQVAGYFADPAAGTRSATTTLFDVQSSAVWRQYSEIDQTSGNTYFASLAQTTGNAAARLPIDAGHLVIDATKTVTLLAQLAADAATGGRGSEVDITGTNIEVFAPGETATAGYLGLNSNQLTALGADSLLIGGVRSDSSDEDTITTTASSVVISTDAAAPLIGPEIILVAGTPKTTTGSGAVRGIVIDTGSVISGKGTLAANDPTSFALADGKFMTAGDSAMLAVSSGSPITVARTTTSGTAGDITIASGARFEGSALALDARGAIAIASGSTYAVQSLSITSTSISIGQVSSGSSGTALSNAVLGELTAVNALTLRSSGAVTFIGNVDLALAGASSTLTLDSGSVATSNNGSVTLAAGTVDLVNSDPAPTGTAAAGSGTFTVDAGTVVLDAGSKQLSGFSTVGLDGTKQVTLTGTGSLDSGSATVDIDTPLILVASGAVQSLTTKGAAALSSSTGVGSAPSTAQIGGTFSLTASAISDSTLIQATAGGVTLEATSKDVTLGPKAEILATGFAQQFFDTVRVTSGGSISLISDQGSIDIATSVAVNGVPTYPELVAQIDVSSAPGYAGNAGSISLSAANGTILSSAYTLNAAGQPVVRSKGAFDFGTVKGSVAGDSGGSLTVDAESLGTSTLVIPSIFSNTVDIHVSTGNLLLGAALTAQNVMLTADSGTLTIGQTINVSGASGGSISLFGGTGVVLTSSGQLLATASSASEHGGSVVIGTEVASENGTSSDGMIDLQGGVIDVSNTADAAMGGTVRLRAPLIGAAGNDVSIDTVAATIKGATSVTIEAFKVFDPSNSAFNGIIDPVAQPGFYGSCTAAGVCTGTLVEFVQDFALSSAAQQKFANISSGILNIQPGIELVNNDLSVNGGNITVANAWNLGAGIAGDLVNLAAFTAGGVTIPAGTVVTNQTGQLLPQYSAYTGQLGYVSGVSEITSLFYRVGGSPTGEAGTLTLRAVNNVDINASITDGFFLTQNRFDKTYLTNLYNWEQNVGAGGTTTNVSDVGGYIVTGATASDPVDGTGDSLGLSGPPLAPYIAGANAISPVATAEDPTPVASADLFPLIKTANGTIVGTDGKYQAIQSWSYRIVGGADTNSANPLAVAPLAGFADGGSGALAGQGNVTIDGGGDVHIADLNSDSSGVVLEIPTIVRTGTGSIDIAAGRDFVLANTEAPGVVYTAGRSSVAPADPDYTMETVNDPLNPGQTITIPVATNPSGFLEPNLLSCDPGFDCNPYGAITTPAYPVDGGNLTITVQQDIIGYEHPNVLGSPGSPNQQYFAPWLIAQGSPLSDTEYGTFSTLSAYVMTDGNIYSPSQTSWWINFGSFDQGVMSVGGNVRIVAGRDIDQLSVSLPTTERTSGGLSNTITNSAGQTVANVPVVSLDPSGDLTVIAGRNIESGSFYEGSGKATIVAGGDVAAGWTTHATPGDSTSPIVGVSTVLAVDTGQLTLTARGSVDIAGVVSAVSLQNVADPTGNTNPALQSTFLSSYGPDSAVTVQSIAGDIVTNSLAEGTYSPQILIANRFMIENSTSVDLSAYRGVSSYPASFEAASLSGNVTVAGSLQLAPSDTGTLSLLAEGSLYTESTANNNAIGAHLAYEFQALSTGPSLIEATFEADDPLAGFGPAPGSQVLDLGAHLLHQNDNVPDRFYAVTGDIISGQGSTTVPAGTTPLYALSWEINKTAQVHAGQDIVDLPFMGQNLAASDVTEIIAGRDLYYTGALPTFVIPGTYSNRPDLTQPENPAGLGLAGPGFFLVQAGRNLGPFVTAQADNNAETNENFDDTTGTGIITFGNNVTVGNRLMTTSNDSSTQIKTDDPFATGVNFLLPNQGADIVTLFGVGKEAPNYQAFINAYINPNTPKFANDPASLGFTDYSNNLVDFLQSLGLSSQSSSGWTKLDNDLSTYETLAGEAANKQGVSTSTLLAAGNTVKHDAWAVYQSLPSKLQDVFADQIYFDELGASVSTPLRGYRAAAILFPDGQAVPPNLPIAPAEYTYNGYTFEVNSKNDLLIYETVRTASGGEVNVQVPDSHLETTADINKVVVSRVSTGNLDMLHGTIKTLQASTITVSDLSGPIASSSNGYQSQFAIGGDIYLFGPGGNIDVGSQAVEVNQHLTASALGILTLDDGVIDSFTDGDVLVNESRILTVQGGNIVMWSSNGNLDAGRGAKTTVDFRPLTVNFSPSSLQTINLNGLVSGAGIGTIQSTPDAPKASAFLAAFRGIINAGDAGVRSSGNLVVAALRVLNASNIAVAGTVTNTTVGPGINLALAVSSSSTGGSSAQAAQDAVDQAQRKNQEIGVRHLPSLITVEVLGFGDCDPESGRACQQ